VPATVEDQPLLRLRGISRSFGTTVGVRQADLDVYAGTVHALLGENGAGKSTLMNVVYGVHPADTGTIEVAGRRLTVPNPRVALQNGIAMVHQHHQLVPSLTVAESLTMTSARTTWRLNRRAAAERVRALGAKLNVSLDPSARVGELSLGDRQRLEILSALDRDANIIILDEPTAVLAPSEVGPLFDLLAVLAADGRAVILITHRMREVFAVSDTISVMRQGSLVRTLKTSATDPDEVLELVIPKRVRQAVAERATPDPGEVGDGDPEGVPTTAEGALTVRELVVAPRPGSTGLRGCSFALRPGEVVGLAGVEGNGQRDLVEVLAGVRVPDSGSVTVCGRPQTPGRLAPYTAIVPEDRHHEGLVLDLSSEENLVLPVLARYSSYGWLDRAAMRAHADEAIEDYAIVTASAAAPVRTMSGGNQQKLVLARALADSPRVLVASQATRGLDPGAAAEVLRRLRLAAAEGAAVLFIGSDLDEVVDVSDRAFVMYGGEVVGESTTPREDQDRLAARMVGADG